MVVNVFVLDLIISTDDCHSVGDMQYQQQSGSEPSSQKTSRSSQALHKHAEGGHS